MTATIVLAAAACVLLLGLAITVSVTVDDWGRDLTQNTAATHPDHADLGLRPLALPTDVADSAELVRSAAGNLANWRLAEDESEGASRRLHFVRTTPLFRFRDDIVVTIAASDDGGGAIVNVDSRSRVGKGDLGQNPRNIKELLTAVGAASKAP